eukprot:jgi/Psemu1/251619/estExt_Genewise1Plus.C_320062
MKRTVLSPERKKSSSDEPSKVPATTATKSSSSSSSSSVRSAVVADLAKDRSRPNQSFSSLALSPKGRYALVAGKDTIQLVSVGPDGLKRVRSLKIAHHFYNSAAETTASSQSQYSDVRGIFHMAAETSVTNMNMNMNMNMNQQFGNITVTKVAWSNNYAPAKLSALKQNTLALSQRGNDAAEETPPKTLGFHIASKKSSSSSSGSSATMLAKQQRTQQPEAILNQHTRAVNGMAWHPTRPGLLLTASQDGSMKLWERLPVTNAQPPEGGDDNNTKQTGDDDDDDDRKYTWRCKATFSLGEQEAVRDIQWNLLLPDVFGVVTSNGNLVVYNMHVAFKALVKIAAHTGDAASLDWHPRWPYIVATGGSGDRFVKIWDLESTLDPILNGQGNSNTTVKKSTPRKDVQVYQQENSNTYGSTNHSSVGISSLSSYGPPTREATTRSTASIWSTGGRHHKSTASGFSKYVLSISASVTQVRWRPPSNDFIPSSSRDDPNNNKQEIMVDRHDSMLAVATARLTSAGGSGTLSLWSFHRPFMSLSVVEGHEESAIADFVWVRTPQTVLHTTSGNSKSKKQQLPASDTTLSSSHRLRSKSIDSPESNHYFEDEAAGGEFYSVSYIWQNVLSVGRDGQCIMQSFARGERRIRHVPSSCFAMANLSPFQQGYGSLQCFSVHQDVPNRDEDDFMLTGLRQDEHTARAPGVFHEEDLRSLVPEKSKHVRGLGQRLPSLVPELRFSVTDQGNLDPNGLPIVNDESALCIAPEVLHLSRFARLYKMYPDLECPTRVELCLYNSRVAEQLKCGPLARMWKTVSTLLHASGLEEIPSHNATTPTNAFQFVIFPTVKSLLLERAEAGDVQTNVVLCEVLQVIDPAGNQTRIPGLGIQLVREWYLSYIDLLHRMCLFSAAAFLIKHCRDPAIGALSQQSTTIHESCPRCGKPVESSADNATRNANAGSSSSCRQICKNCRRRVGICFICHEPVQGVFVWCPGCGHGGHLEHALQWFGGLDGRAVRTVCPTGCGHKCNLVQFASTFPRTMSMALSDSSSMEHAALAVPGHQARCVPATTPSLYNLDKNL